MTTLTERFWNALSHVVPALEVSREPELLERYGGDWTRVYPRAPGGVCWPRSTAEVSALLRLASEHELPVVPSGGRTGLAAGAVASRGELVLSLERMNRIDEVDVVGQTLRVEAGAITATVHEACRAHGLIWPIDLGSRGSCHIGGNLATNAGGVRVIRYGATRHWVLGIVAVRMGGEVLRTGGSLMKNNTGYDLTQLLVGSEGTLAVITEATLKLTRAPPPGQVMLFGVRDLQAALYLSTMVRSSPFEVMAIEFFSAACLEEVVARGHGKSPFASHSPVYLLVEVTSRDRHELEAWVEKLLTAEYVDDGVLANSAAQGRALWSLRENITTSLAARGLVHKSDVAVPVRGLAAFARELESVLDERYPDLDLFLFGHVGDGNLHVNLVQPAGVSSAEFLARLESVDEDIGRLLAHHGGSVSAEHGIGLLKKKLLSFTRSDGELALFRHLKKAFDPQGLLNPGKIVEG
ncbi:MAG: FAD-binding oxidoreductase [Myxococcota bacterium]